MSKTRKRSNKPSFFDVLIFLSYIVLSIVLYVLLGKMNVLTDALSALIICALIFFFLILLILQVIGRKSRWVSRVLAVILIIGLVTGSLVAGKTLETLKHISGDESTSATFSVYVPAGSSYQSLDDLANSQMGVQDFVDEDVVDTARYMLEQEIWFDYIRHYDSYADLVEALLTNEVNCILIDEAYLDMIDEYDSDFFKKARSLYSFTFEKDQEIPDESSEPEEESWDPTYVSSLTQKPFAVFLSGLDSRTGNLDKANSDSNIIAVINPITRNVLLLSTPRDYYVTFTVPGKEPFMDKLTHAGCYGTAVSMKALQDIYGLDDLSYYAKINFTGLEQLVDALGGVEINSDADFDIKDHPEMHVTKGWQHMNGAEALLFARERYHLVGGDRARGRHQMEVLRAIVSKVISNPSVLLNYDQIMLAVAGNFKTNVSVKDIGAFIQLELNDFSPWKLYSYGPSGEDASRVCPTYSTSRELYAMIPYENQVQAAKTYVQAIMDGKDIPNLTPTIIGDLSK